ncbi:hypothetical protein ACEWY4_023421 [Coilia grayii]|uniref:EGF-like domain-containing protein n=1 Tax=Coilia grayii TaxID=363190 RepID=A0ABD1J302_9TELE
METCTLRVIDHLVLIVLFTLVKSLDGTFTPRTATDSIDSTLVSRGFSSVAFTDLSKTALPEELATSRTDYMKETSTDFGDSLVGITDIPRDFSEKSHTEMKSATELKSYSSTEAFTAERTTTHHSTESVSSSTARTASDSSITEREHTEPEHTEPAHTERQRTELEATEREHTEPDHTQRQHTEQGHTVREHTERGRMELVPTEREPTEREPTEPVHTQRQHTEPEHTEPEHTERGRTEPEYTKPERTDFTHLPPILSRDSRRSLEARTIRESPAVSRPSTGDPDAPSQTDSTYVSSTISRAGERTLLSVTSNSTSPYTTTDDFGPSEVSSKAFIWGERTGEPTHSRGTSEGDGSTSTGFDLTATISDSQRTPNGSEGGFSETKGHDPSTWTQSQTSQPNVTQQGFEQTSDTDVIFSSTPPLTVLNDSNNNRGWGTDADGRTDMTDTGHTHNDETSHTGLQDGVRSSTSPSLSSESDHSSTPQQVGGERTVTGVVGDRLSTEPSTGSVSTGRLEETDGVQPLTEEGTTIILGLTTASPAVRGGTVTGDVLLFKFPSGQQPFTPETEGPTEPNETLRPTASEPSTPGPQHTEREGGTPTDAPTFSTPAPPTTTIASSSTTTIPTTITTRLLEPSTSVESQTQPTTIITTDTTQGPAPSTPSTPSRSVAPPSRTGGPHTSTRPEEEGRDGGKLSTDVTTLHLETSTATPGNTTAQHRPTTASYAKSTAPTPALPAHTTQSRTTTTQPPPTTATTHADIKPTTPTPGLRCGAHVCANGGTCVMRAGNTHSCVCLPAWTGPSCTKDVNECESSPCPSGSTCVNTNGSFSCECPLGSDLENGRECTKVKTFLGSFSVNSTHSSSLHEVEGEIKHLLNASLSILRGYIRSSCHWKGSVRNGSGEWSLKAVNMFSISADVNGTVVLNSIQLALRNCSQHPAHCRVHGHRLSYHAESLCKVQNHQCDPARSVCRDDSGAPYCECREGYYKHNEQDKTCLACGDGYQLKNGVCVNCTFGFGGFNCTNFYKLIAIVVAPAVGGLLLILTIALIVTCCRKDKNDINKIIFKSGDLQMSPYADFPKSNRVSMEWGRETIEMQENGSTKNLLQMTDIYYSPALRNSDLERNGLYPFSGLPGSRHSCIYPAQWNPSFICDDSRRRDYF